MLHECARPLKKTVREQMQSTGSELYHCFVTVAMDGQSPTSEVTALKACPAELSRPAGPTFKLITDFLRLDRALDHLFAAFAFIRGVAACGLEEIIRRDDFKRCVPCALLCLVVWRLWARFVCS